MLVLSTICGVAHCWHGTSKWIWALLQRHCRCRCVWVWYCLAYLHSASVYICALFLEWHCNISWYFCTCCCRLWRNCCWCWICNVLVSDLVFDLNCIYSAYVCWRCWWDFGFSLTGKLENLAEYPSKVGRIFFSVEEKWLVPSTLYVFSGPITAYWWRTFWQLKHKELLCTHYVHQSEINDSVKRAG